MSAAAGVGKEARPRTMLGAGLSSSAIGPGRQASQEQPATRQCSRRKSSQVELGSAGQGWAGLGRAGQGWAGRTCVEKGSALALALHCAAAAAATPVQDMTYARPGG